MNHVPLSRATILAALLLLPSLGACGGQASVSLLFTRGDSIVGVSPGPLDLLAGSRIRVRGSRPGETLAEGELSFGMFTEMREVGRWGVRVENLPAGWTGLALYEDTWLGFGDPELRVDVMRAALGETSTPAPGPEEGEGSPWGRFLLWGFIGLVALYTIFMTGVSGGPNNGEHPFIVSLMVLIGFLFVAPLWPSAYWWAFLLLVLAALVLGFLVMGIRIWNEPGKVWAARGAYALIIAGMIWLVATETPPTAKAEWSGRDLIHLRFTAGDSVAIRLLDANGEPVYAMEAWERPLAHVLLFWPDEETPDAAEVTFPGGHTVIRELPERPEG